MSLTFGQAKDILAQYQGKGGKLPTADQVNTFVIKVLQYMLFSGASNSERTFTFHAVNGVITAPYELETPLKVRIDGRIGNVGNKWFDYRSGNDMVGSGCLEAQDVLIEDPNYYCTAYDLPAGGARIGILGTASEPEGSYVIVSGTDATGREVFTNHRGGQVAGEYLEIRKGQITWSNVSFATVDGIVKTRTLGYTPLYWKVGEVKGFLSDYSPVEEVPSYRRFRIQVPNCPALAKVSVLGRIRLKSFYADTDRIPFDNLYAIEVAGQQVNLNYNDQIEAAVQKDNFLQSLIGREATYKKQNNGQPLEVFHPLSAGTIKGIVGR
jgi:hypothetical protein